MKQEQEAIKKGIFKETTNLSKILKKDKEDEKPWEGRNIEEISPHFHLPPHKEQKYIEKN